MIMNISKNPCVLLSPGRSSWQIQKAEVPLPGGCNIGSRPIDQHLKGFRALGAEVNIRHGAIMASASDLHGSHIFMDMVSVGATINVMMAASMARGNTTIENAAKEPHVVDVANFLNSMGANIKGAGTDVIRIKGVDTLHGTSYAVVPDMIEAGTYMFAAAATKGDVLVKMLFRSIWRRQRRSLRRSAATWKSLTMRFV